MKYSVIVRFETEVEADTQELANEAINDLIDQLGDVETKLNWDNVDWIMIENE